MVDKIKCSNYHSEKLNYRNYKKPYKYDDQRFKTNRVMELFL